MQFKSLVFFFFSTWVFFHEHSRITGLQGKGEGISSTPYYHFHPLHSHLYISRAITAESSSLHLAYSREPLVSERKSLTIKPAVGFLYSSSSNKILVVSRKKLSATKSFIKQANHINNLNDQ